MSLAVPKQAFKNLRLIVGEIDSSKTMRPRLFVELALVVTRVPCKHTSKHPEPVFSTQIINEFHAQGNKYKRETQQITRTTVGNVDEEKKREQS